MNYQNKLCQSCRWGARPINEYPCNSCVALKGKGNQIESNHWKHIGNWDEDTLNTNLPE